MAVTEQVSKLGRPFGYLWSAAVSSSIGDGAFVVAMPLLAAYLTRDPKAVALVSAAATAPWFLVSIWAGAVVDRLPRRAVVVSADLVRALALVVLAVLVLTGHATVVALAAVAFIVVTGKVFFDPAAQAMLPNVVGRDKDTLTRANGRLFAGETVGQSLAGPPVGGYTFTLSPAAPFILDAASFVVSASLLSRVPRQDAPAEGRDQGVGAASREGFAYLFRSRQLVLLSVSVMAFNVAWNLAAATFVLYAKGPLGASDFVFSLLIAASAVGGILAGWVAGPLLKITKIPGAIIGTMGLQALGWLAIVATGSVWAAGVGYAFIGAASTLSTVAVVSARQHAVPDHLLGRVVSAFRLLGNGVGPLGAAAGGLIASAAGLRAPFVVAIGVLIVGAVALVVPLFRTPS